MLTILLGIVLTVLSIPVGMIITPILIMAGAMGASDDPNSDDPNNGKVEFALGFGVCIFALVLPVAMFVGGLVLIF